MAGAKRGDAPRQRLYRRLAELGITVSTVPYPAVGSVAEAKQLRGDLPGTFTKNLLLRDKKERLFLFFVAEDRTLDLRTLHRKVRAGGRLGFAPAERMRQVLQVEPGALTPFALINDDEGQVAPVVDASLLEAEQLNFHPLASSESMGLRPDQLLAFIRSCGREALIVDLDG